MHVLHWLMSARVEAAPQGISARKNLSTPQSDDMTTDDIPSTTELIRQAVNSDLTRILSTNPPPALRVARRADGAQRFFWMLTAALVAGASGVMVAALCDVVSFTAVIGLLVGAALSLALAGVFKATTLTHAHLAREDVRRVYSVEVRPDGEFTLLRDDDIHPDLAATRAVIRARASA